MTDEDPEEHALGYQAVPKGTPVEAADGNRVGTFEKSLYHGREDLLDGIVIRTPAGNRFVDAPEVARMTNMRVILEIDSAAIAELEPYKGLLGRIGESTSRRARRRANRLRRR
ncbi:MAG: hypothetical protein QOD43_458 [Gaiellaceae bacterium]|nr:hypothetical protein [Gaiellaceae bacterium]